MFNPYPFMEDAEVKIIDEILKELRPVNCLEWGSGGSTIYFPTNHNYIKKWLAIEHDREWADKLNEYPLPITANVELKRFPDYFSFPTNQYDFILVDGRERTACIRTIIDNNLLSSRGIVLLHDSGRIRYQPVFSLFKYYLRLFPNEEIRNEKEDAGLTKFWNYSSL